MTRYHLIWYDMLWYDMMYKDIIWCFLFFLSWYNIKCCDSILYIKMISNQSFQIIFHTFPLPFTLTHCMLTSPLILLLSYSYSLLVSLNHHSCTNKWHVRAVDWIGNLIILHLSWSFSYYSLSSPLLWFHFNSYGVS